MELRGKLTLARGRLRLLRGRIRGRSKALFDKEKVFCIGLNKTGTTSLEAALGELGYVLGNQVAGEMTLRDYARRDFTTLLQFCHSADAFQDAPFSFPFTFIVLDQHFPNAKFILTVRDSAEQWYRSLTAFHSKRFGHGRVPTKEDLLNAGYRYRGRAWEANRILFNTPEDDPYCKPVLLSYYEHHNYSAREYFRTKSNFLEINLSDDASYARMCAFLGRPPARSGFPWKNKTDDVRAATSD